MPATLTIEVELSDKEITRAATATAGKVKRAFSDRSVHQALDPFFAGAERGFQALHSGLTKAQAKLRSFGGGGLGNALQSGLDFLRNKVDTVTTGLGRAREELKKFSGVTVGQAFRGDLDFIRRKLQEGATAARAFGASMRAGLEAGRATLKDFGQDAAQAGARLAAALTLPLVGFGQQAIEAALKYDKFRTTLTAIEGSADKAKTKIAELTQLAAESPGVLTSAAIGQYAQLRAIGEVTETSINKIIRATGKLGAVFDLGNQKDFTRNLVQIFQQGFERGDIKEAIGRVPIFEQLLATAFGTKDPDKLRQLKESGALTLDSFLSGLADGVQNNPKLAGVQDSLSVRFQKLQERVQLALVPLGEQLLNILGPALTSLTALLEKLSAAFTQLNPNVQNALVIFGLVAAVVGPLVVGIGALAAAIGTIGAPVALAISALTALGTAIGVAYVQNLGGVSEKTAAVFGFIRSFVQEQMGALLAWWQQNLPVFKEAAVNVLNALRAFWQAHGEQITAIVQTYLNNTVAIIQGLVRIIGDVFKLIAQIINGDWQGVWATAQSIVATFARAVLTVLSNLAQGVFSAMKLVGSVIADALLFLVNKTFEIGGQIIQGLVNGISAGASLVYSKMKDLAIGALQVAKAALGISSPSKEMEIIGAFVGAGFVQGLDKAQGSVEKAIRQLVGANLKAAQDEVAQLTAEIGALLAATPKQFQAEAEIEQLNQLKASLRELLALRKERGFSGLSQADIANFGVTGALAQARINQRIQQTGGRANVILDLPNLADPLEEQRRAQEVLDEKVADFANTLRITQEAASHYERALAAINNELAGLDDTQKEQLLYFARQKDAYEQARQQAEELQRQVQGIAESVANSLTSIFTAFVQSGFKGGLKAIGNELKTFANALLKNILGGLASNIANSLIGKLFGGGSLQGTSASSGGGLLGGLLGGLFGAPGGTAPLAGTSSGSGALGSIFGGLFGGGSSLSVPASATGGTRGVLSAPGLSGLGSANQRGTGGTLANLFGGVSGLFKGFGFNAKAGSAAPGSLASLAPLLGLSLGVGLGGQSRLGQIVGGAGGALLGIGLTAVPTALAGATTGLAGATAALFSNPITAAVGGVLLIGSFLLGKAKQRKADEAKVDTYWVEYMNVLKELTARVNADRINGDEALAQAAEARSTAIDLISQIKTKSVRESRLRNQIPDVDRLFLEPLKEAVERQRKRGARVNQLIPEFAVGGIVPGIDVGRDSVLAWLRPGEVVLTKQHQALLGGDRTFAQIGVPGFAQGGKVEVIERFSAATASSTRLELDLNVGLRVDETGEIVVAGLRTQRGQNATVRARRINRLNREDL